MKEDMKSFLKNSLSLLVLSLFLISFLSLGACGARIGTYAEKVQPVSDHFDGNRYFNSGSPSKEGEGPKRGVFGWILQWMAGNDWPEWPEFNEFPPGPPPPARVPKGTLRITPVGHSTFLIQMDELDWWQSIPLSSEVRVTLVPAQHFSSRGLWDRNRALWGGFVLSGPSGNIYFSGDSGYCPHFSEIARRFSPIRVAILPISPYQPKSSDKPSSDYRLRVHMRPREAVQAHLDLEAQVSIAAHFQVFQLGPVRFSMAGRGRQLMRPARPALVG